MEHSLKRGSPGHWIREMRERREIATREVERITQAIAGMKGNEDFYISHSTLVGIESGSVPSIHKLYSLAAVLRVTLREMLSVFGIDLETPPPHGKNALIQEPPFRFQLNFDTKSFGRETTMLNLKPQDIKSLPQSIQKWIDTARYRYAVIGTEDDSMADLLPPSSVAEVDSMQDKVRMLAWRTLQERPIYMVWHSHGYACCWCQLDGKELYLIPHPASHKPVRRYSVPSEASVIGRVTSAWIPLTLAHFPAATT